MLPCRHLPSFHPQIPAPTPGTSDKPVQPKRLEGQNVQPWQTRSVAFKSRPARRGEKRRESVWSTESLQRAGPAASAAPCSSTNSFQPSVVGKQRHSSVPPWFPHPSASLGSWKNKDNLRASLVLEQSHLPSLHSAHVGIKCPRMWVRSPSGNSNPHG